MHCNSYSHFCSKYINVFECTLATTVSVSDKAVDFSCIGRYPHQPKRAVSDIPAYWSVLLWWYRGSNERTVYADSGRINAYGHSYSKEPPSPITYRKRGKHYTVSKVMGSMENSLGSDTSKHLRQTYVLLVLIYGLEVVLPKAALVEKLERTYKQFIKHIPTQRSVVSKWNWSW